MPLFSIIMPTRNRAALLPYALRSAMNQTFDEYEIVVSDNFSSDDTPQVVKQLNDGRVRYFRTDRVLSNPDSWEFALSKARGEWITFLSDDDAISSTLLQNILEVNEKTDGSLVCWPAGYYIYETLEETTHRYMLFTPPFTGRITEVRSRAELANIFGLSSFTRMPRMINSCCNQDVIRGVRRRIGRFFLPTLPDFSSGVATLSIVEKYTYVDIPLCVFGGHPGLRKRVERFLAFIREFEEGSLFEHVPLHALVMTNFIADSLLRVKEIMPDLLSFVEIDWERYFTECYAELRRHANHGDDVSSELGEFFAVVNQLPVSIRSRVHSNIRRTRRIGMLLDMIRSATYHYGTLASLKFLILDLPLLPRSIRCKAVRCKDILEAVHYIDNLLTRPRRWSVGSL